jgi:putative ABC transport system permease protein
MERFISKQIHSFMKTRYKKVLRDLTVEYGKTFMLAIAVAIGVFGIGTIMGGYGVLKREMRKNYLGTNPASATLEIDTTLSDNVLESINMMPGIKEVERHTTRGAQMKVGDKWYKLLLFVRDDFKNIQTNKFTHLSGEKEPPVLTMLIEHTALELIQTNIGDKVLVKAADSTQQVVRLVGTVHDPGLAPARQERVAYGYITMATLEALGGNPLFDELRITVTENSFSREHIEKKARQVANWLLGNKVDVHEVQIPNPGQHPHQSQMDAIMMIFVLFSFLILVLAGLLVSVTMASVMVKQVRQIGVMKTIGGDSRQVALLYFSMVLVICVAALVMAIPLSRIAAVSFYNQIAYLLNIAIIDDFIPNNVLVIQIASGIGIPLVAVAFPVIRGSRISIRSALDNYGVRQQIHEKRFSWIIRLSQFNSLGELFPLALRNAFRNQSRLIMTVSLLAAGGAIFMTALNVSKAWDKNLQRIYQQKLYDLEVRLTNPLHDNSIIADVKSISGVKDAEQWAKSATSFYTGDAYPITHVYPDKGHGSFTVQALPVNSVLIQPTVKEGSWLENERANDIVLNQVVRSLAPHIKVGDTVRLMINKKVSDWKVAGFVEDFGSPAAAYVSLAYFKTLDETKAFPGNIKVGYYDRSRESASLKNNEVIKRLESRNATVASTLPIWSIRNAVGSHMKVLVNSLIAMATLMGLVGLIGLASSMSINVFERTREIGIMRAVGATPSTVRDVIVWEAMIMAVGSLLLAILLSVILSSYFCQLLGNISFRTPLSLAISWMGIGIWIVVIILGTLLATHYPIRRANTITTREALAYE